LISTYTNSAHQTQADEVTLNQQVPGSSPGRNTKIAINSCSRTPAGASLAASTNYAFALS